ncbi:MAG: ribonuclease P [Thermoplasmata archaeon]|nr:ribonuclease P [Thermoplasmata archaeon]
MVRRRRKGLERRIARERMDVLFELAEEEARRGNLPRSNRYVRLARRLGMRYNVPFPSAHRRRYCRGCGAFLAPGAAARVRLRRARVIVTCRTCGRVSRYPYLREVRGRRRPQ